MKTLSITELKAKLHIVEESPRNYFGTDIDEKLRDLLAEAHPDHFKDPTENKEAEIIFKRFHELADEVRTPPQVIDTKTRSYTLEKLMGVGDVSDVHLATCNEEHYVIKVSRIVGADKLLMHENFVLKELIDAANDSTYQWYLPQPQETVKAKSDINTRINVFTYEPGGFTLEQVHNKYPGGLDGKHIAWVFKRLLTVIGYAHTKKWIHNAVLPPHVMIFPGTHGLQLLDWKTASQSGPMKLISGRYRDWYPPEVTKKEDTGPGTDIYMAAKCMIYLAGGDPVKGTMPASFPRQVAGYLRSAILDPIRMRPKDAWDFLDEFTKMLEEVYGKPKFHPLSMI